MKQEDYISTQAQILAIARIVNDIPLYEFIEAAARAETIGPLIDPTTYLAAADNLTTIKHLAQSLVPFKRTIEDLARQVQIPTTLFVQTKGN